MARPRRNPDDVQQMIAVESGWWKAPDGTEYTFRAGETIVRDDHPLVTLGNRAWFKPVEETIRRPDVEQATNAPGEMREVEDRVV